MVGAAVTLATSGTRGGRERRPRRAPLPSRRRPAPSAAQWKGALTGSMIERRAPRSRGDRDRALDRGRVAADDDLARRHCRWRPRRPRPAPARLRRPRARASISRPSSAAIAPSPTGTAFCIAWPRRFSSRAASATDSAAGRGQRRIFAERMAGDIGDVRGRGRTRPRLRARASPRGSPPSAPAGRSRSGSGRSSGPSNISRDRFCDSASSTSSNRSRAPARTPRRGRAPCRRLRALARKDKGPLHARRIPLASIALVIDLPPALSSRPMTRENSAYWHIRRLSRSTS